MIGWRRLWGRERADRKPDLVPRWKAFLEAPPHGDEPVIPPANVPAVKPLVGVKVDKFAEFRKRYGR